MQNGLKKSSCQVLAKMNFGRSCKGGAPVHPNAVTSDAAEKELIDQFYIKDRTQIQIVTNHKTFLKAEAGGVISAKGSKEAMDAVYEVHVPGGGRVHFGKKVALKNLCSGKFLGAEGGKLKGDRNSYANGAALFQLIDAENVGNHGGMKDFALSTLKAYDGRWLRASNSGDITMDGPSITTDAKVRVMKVPHNKFTRGSC